MNPQYVQYFDFPDLNECRPGLGEFGFLYEPKVCFNQYFDFPDLDECGQGVGEFGTIRLLPGAVLPVCVVHLYEGGMASDGDSVSGRRSGPLLSGINKVLSLCNVEFKEY